MRRGTGKRAAEDSIDRSREGRRRIGSPRSPSAASSTSSAGAPRTSPITTRSRTQATSAIGGTSRGGRDVSTSQITTRSRTRATNAVRGTSRGGRGASTGPFPVSSAAGTRSSSRATSAVVTPSAVRGRGGRVVSTGTLPVSSAAGTRSSSRATSAVVTPSAVRGAGRGGRGVSTRPFPVSSAAGTRSSSRATNAVVTSSAVRGTGRGGHGVLTYPLPVSSSSIAVVLGTSSGGSRRTLSVNIAAGTRTTSRAVVASSAVRGTSRGGSRRTSTVRSPADTRSTWEYSSSRDTSDSIPQLLCWNSLVPAFQPLVSNFPLHEYLDYLEFLNFSVPIRIQLLPLGRFRREYLERLQCQLSVMCRKYNFRHEDQLTNKEKEDWAYDHAKKQMKSYCDRGFIKSGQLDRYLFNGIFDADTSVVIPPLLFGNRVHFGPAGSPFSIYGTYTTPLPSTLHGLRNCNFSVPGLPYNGMNRACINYLARLQCQLSKIFAETTFPGGSIEEKEDWAYIHAQARMRDYDIMGIITSAYFIRRMLDADYPEDVRLPLKKYKQEMCSICLDTMGNGVEPILIKCKPSYAKCGHWFHHNCIMTWMKDGKFTCPNCNQNVTGMARRIRSSDNFDDCKVVTARKDYILHRGWFNGIFSQDNRSTSMVHYRPLSDANLEDDPNNYPDYRPGYDFGDDNDDSSPDDTPDDVLDSDDSSPDDTPNDVLDSDDDSDDRPDDDSDPGFALFDPYNPYV